MADNRKIIAQNKKARHDYFIEQTLEAGISLLGWEVKSLRAGRVQLKESYVIVKNGELFLFGAHISPLPSASNHIDTDPTRTRKLLLRRLEINRLSTKIGERGMTVVALKLYWAGDKIKLTVGLAKGKRKFEKREDLKKRDWEREKERTLKNVRK